MAEIRLYGHLRDSFTDKVTLLVSSFPEVIRALSMNFPTFSSEMEKDNRQYKIFIDNSQLSADNLSLSPIGDNSVIKIVPVLEGAGEGKDPMAMILIGAMIIATGGFGLVTLAGGATTGLAAFGANMAMGIGYSLIAGGIASLMQEGPAEEVDPNSSTIIGPVNTTAQGAAIPIGYGRMRIGSAVISAAIDIDQGILAPLKYIEVNGISELVVVGTLHVPPVDETDET